MTVSKSPQLRDWYDFPQYFDWAFADETEAEVEFFQAAFERYAVGNVKRVYEPGCGSGRLLDALARKGFQSVGIDNNQKMVEFTRKRLAKLDPKAEISVGDMRFFRPKKQVDAAFSTFNTFRHLTTEDDALAFLQSIVASVRSGGIFVLGLHLLPLDVDLDSWERWKVQRGKTTVNYSLRVVQASRSKRIERLRMSIHAKRGGMSEKVVSEFDLRMYTASQLKSLLRKVPELDLLDVFDFYYEINEPLKLDNVITDTVLVFRRK